MELTYLMKNLYNAYADDTTFFLKRFKFNKKCISPISANPTKWPNTLIPIV